MTEKYQKIHFDDHPAFRLHHTFGHNAGSSTLGHLHTNDKMMLIFFQQGTGSIKIEGHHYDIHEGDAILLNPSEVFLCSVDNAQYHERIVLYIHDDFLRETPYDTPLLFRPFLDRRKGIGNHIPASLVQQYQIDRMLSELLDTVQDTKELNRLLSYSKLVELLVCLSQITLSDAQLRPEPTKENAQVDNILDYLDTHFQEASSIDQLAADFRISKSYLSHLFKAHVGIPLWNYVILRRLHAFNSLIRNGSSIEEACWQVGFQNYSNFFRLYKKHMGVTPMQYKQQLNK